MVTQLTENKVVDTSSGRSRKMLQTIFKAFVYKGLSVLLSLLIVPLSVNYLDAERYGIWITISSVLTWINLMDIGLGNGLRNKLVQALHGNDEAMARKLVSTTYALVIGLISLLVLGVVPTLYFIDLNKALNSQTVDQQELFVIVLTAFLSFCLLFVLKPLTAVIMATQNASIDNLILLAGNVLSLGGIGLILYTQDGPGNLVHLVLVFSVAPVLAYLAGSVYFYRKLYPSLRPALRDFDRAQVRNLAGMSLQFFIIQISATILLTANNIILSQLFGNQQVTEYNVVFRYFSVVTIVQNIVLTPVWSAVTDAYHKGDFAWIQQTLKKLLLNAALLSAGIGGQVLVAPWVFEKWLGPSVEVHQTIVWAVALNTVLTLIASTFSYIINGIGRIRIQTFTSVTTTLVSIPVALYLGRHYGPAGVVLSGCLWLALWLPLRITQYFKLMNQTATGLWNK